MTPRLQQAVKLLQLGSAELSQFIDAELERNPLLERDDDPESPPEPLSISIDGRIAEPPPRPDRAVLDAFNGAIGRRPTGSPSTGSPSTGPPSGASGPALSMDRDGGPSGTSLHDHLLGQLGLTRLGAEGRLIGIHLIDMVDDAGYVDGEFTPIAETLGCDVARIDEVLAELQRFEPTGVFARSLKECLALQLAERDRLDDAMIRLLDNLELLANRNFDVLRRRCRVDNDGFEAMIAALRRLDPKPGLAYSDELTQAVVPDVVVERDDGGGWRVELNPDTVPRLQVNKRYYTDIAGQTRSKPDKAYLADRLQSAQWLVRSLAQRADTLLRVASELVRRQEAFLTHGVRLLRPLVLNDVATALTLHESTISRVTANKFMATPRGVIAMRYLFSNALPGTDGAQHATEAVRHRINSLIVAEDAAHPLSDEAIAALLENDGIAIARRTVAKYRVALRIPSSARRRRRPSHRVKP